MADEIYSSLILLTYKNKALLSYKQKDSLDEGGRPWSLIASTKNIHETFENAFERRLQDELGIKVDNVEHVSDSFYHASLTDSNVNQIKREEGQLFSFFTIKELKNLLLTVPTREFVSKHGNLISEIN